MSERNSPLLPAVIRDVERPTSRYEVIAPVAMERRDEPFWLSVGRAFVLSEAPQGPVRIRVKIDAVPHLGRIVQLGPTEGYFDLVLEPEPELEDTVRVRPKIGGSP